MTVPKDLAEKRDLRFSRMEQGVDQWVVPLCKESFDAGVEAAFESEHVLALVEALEEKAKLEPGPRGYENIAAGMALAKWSKRNE